MVMKNKPIIILSVLIGLNLLLICCPLAVRIYYWFLRSNSINDMQSWQTLCFFMGRVWRFYELGYILFFASFLFSFFFKTKLKYLSILISGLGMAILWRLADFFRP